MSKLVTKEHATLIANAVIDKVKNKGYAVESDLGSLAGKDEVDKIDLSSALAQEIDSKLDAADILTYTVKKQTTADTGYSSTYQLYSVSADDIPVETPVGAKINIPKDMVVESGTVGVVTVADEPYEGAVVGDKYIDLVIANADDDHIYIPVGDLVDIYEAGNGIDITNNVISVIVDSNNANGLRVSANGISVSVATVSGIIENRTYTLGSGAHTNQNNNIQVKCLSVNNGIAIMQTYGITSEQWPGKGDLTDLYSSYFGTLSGAISEVKLPKETNPAGSYDILVIAAGNYSSFGGEPYAWLGSGSSSEPDVVWSDGNVGYKDKNVSCVIAPYFKLDLSKIKLNNGVIEYSIIGSMTAGVMSAIDKEKLDNADFVPYTEGNGIDITSHTISTNVVTANGLSVGANGVAMSTVQASVNGVGGANGAMSGSDKEKLNDVEITTASELADLIANLNDLDFIPPTPLKFSSDGNFVLSVANPGWNGTIEYSLDDGDTWSTWDGSQLSGDEDNDIYLRGTGNNIITGNDWDHIWTFTGKYCTGTIELLLDYQSAENGIHPTMSSNCYRAMFKDCTSLVQAPELPAITLTSMCYCDMFMNCRSLILPPKLPATTLASMCYDSMFSDCISLTTLPELPATTLTGSCYSHMFASCGSLKLSTIQTEEYQYSYRIPIDGTGVETSDSLLNMFMSTGGTFKGTPTINTTYYTTNQPV